VHETGLVLTLASGFVAALIFGYVTQRIGLSPIVGYLLAGVIV
jgi:CPA2 family monovalent cation:H+ antiporter-2